MARKFVSNTLLFFATNEYFVTGSATLSFSVWVKPTRLGSETCTPFSYGVPGSESEDIVLLRYSETTGAVSCLVRDILGSEFNVSGGVLPANEWSNITVIIQEEADMVLYVNGSEVGSTDASSWLGIYEGKILFIGLNPNTQEYMRGDVAELAVWDDEISLTDLASLNDGIKATEIRLYKPISYVPLLYHTVEEINDIVGFNQDTTLAAEHAPIVQLTDPVIELVSYNVRYKPLIVDNGIVRQLRDDDGLNLGPNAVAGNLVNTGGRVSGVSRYTSNQTLTNTDHVVFCDTNAAAFTISLPGGVSGTTYKIINTGTNTLTLTPNNDDLLLGENSNFYLLNGDALVITFEPTEGWL